MFGTQPRTGVKREVELGSHSQLDSPLLQLSTAGCRDSVLVTLFRTAVQKTSCEVDKLLRKSGVPTSLTATGLLVADGLFGLCGSERLGRAARRYQPRQPTKLVFEISGPEVFLDPSSL